MNSLTKNRPSQAPFLILYRAELLTEVAVVAVLATILFLTRTRVFSSFSTHFMGGASEDAGLYIWNRGDGLLRRVLPGVVSHGVTGHPAVSPDGCRVAFGYARNMSQNRPRTRTLRVLELCQGGKSDGQGRPQPDCAGCEPRGVR